MINQHLKNEIEIINYRKQYIISGKDKYYFMKNLFKYTAYTHIHRHVQT